MEISDVVSIRIRKRRKELGLSQDKLAGLADISDKSVKAYERGISLPGAYALVQMAKVLEVSTDYLVGLSDFAEPTDKTFADVCSKGMCNRTHCERSMCNAVE